MTNETASTLDTRITHRQSKLPLGPAVFGFLSVLFLPFILVETLSFAVSPILLTLAGLWISFGLSFLCFNVAAKKVGRKLTYNHSWKQIPQGLLLGVLLQLGLVLVGFLIVISFGFDPSEVGNTSIITDVNYEIDFLTMVIVLLGVALIAPVLEELFFRGVILPAVSERLGKVIAVLISSALFGVLHTQPELASTIYTVLMTSLGGVFFAFLRLRSNSLVLPIAAHVGFNSWALMLVFLVSL